MAEYNFIKPDFTPAATNGDIDDYKESEDTLPPFLQGESTQAIVYRLAQHNRQPRHLNHLSHSTILNLRHSGETTSLLRTWLTLLNIASGIGQSTKGVGGIIPATRLTTIEEQEEIAEENRAAEGEREASGRRWKGRPASHSPSSLISQPNH